MRSSMPLSTEAWSFPGRAASDVFREPSKWGFRLALDWDVFWRQSVRDGIYSPPGQLLRSGRVSRARFVGHQPGAKLDWRFNRHLAATVAYNHFFAGDFIEETGAGQDIDFVAAWVIYRF